ncbi:MAG TPA: L-threonylcarbamoyladenylate synthase [Solirubrobacterales bacterium]|nr:L-threonylcarbamoyladenylate synthase [Solirubrobacterales bacterium]
MSEVVSVLDDGEQAAREALEACILAGGVAIFPADGLYGLACDPASPAAIRRIHALKGRPASKASAVLYFDRLAMRELLGSMGERTGEAVARLLPGPVTLVIANPDERYPLACGDDPRRLGVRLIEGPLAGARCPVFQTSANLSGEPAPAAFADVDLELVRAVDLAIDGGALTGEPSTVVDISRIDSDGSWDVLREGAMGRAEVERRLGAGS